MPQCPKCSQEMSLKGKRMECQCGYSYRLPKRKPTYNELLTFIQDNQYEQELQDWLEVE